MGKEIIKLGYNEVEKHKLHQQKGIISMHDVNINRTVVSNKVPFGKKGFKCFIGYEGDSEKVINACV